MTPSEKRKLTKRRDTAKRNAEKFEAQAQGKSQFVAGHLLREANKFRSEEQDCNFWLSQK